MVSNSLDLYVDLELARDWQQPLFNVLQRKMLEIQQMVCQVQWELSRAQMLPHATQMGYAHHTHTHTHTHTCILVYKFLCLSMSLYN